MGNMLRIKSVSQNPYYTKACYRLESSCKLYSEKMLVDSKDFRKKNCRIKHYVFVKGIYFTYGRVYSLKIFSEDNAALLEQLWC